MPKDGMATLATASSGWGDSWDDSCGGVGNEHAGAYTVCYQVLKSH